MRVCVYFVCGIVFCSSPCSVWEVQERQVLTLPGLESYRTGMHSA